MNKRSKKPTTKKRNKKPLHYEGYHYYENPEGDLEPSLMAYMSSHEHVKDGFTATIHGKPHSYTLHFIPQYELGHDKKAWEITRKLAAKLR